ncbi:MAG: response regulator transcription factor [Synergistaceae bacterium]|nr:response regulator transcription factor [Synergistaceae bacterium]
MEAETKTKTKKILCVEDETDILANNRDALIEGGYSVLTAENLAQARDHLSKQTPDAIVLDIMLPDGNGLAFLKELREAGNRVPVIMLTAWNKNADIAGGLRAGANDYLGKPFSYDVLLARVEALFRNVGYVPDSVEKGPLKLDIAANQAFLDGADMLLTQKEFSLLLLFVQNEGRFMSVPYLYEKVWGQSMEKDTQAIRKSISRLRSKLKGCGFAIVSYRDEGYRLEKV